MCSQPIRNIIQLRSAATYVPRYHPGYWDLPHRPRCWRRSRSVLQWNLGTSLCSQFWMFWVNSYQSPHETIAMWEGGSVVLKFQATSSETGSGSQQKAISEVIWSTQMKPKAAYLIQKSVLGLWAPRSPQIWTHKLHSANVSIKTETAQQRGRSASWRCKQRSRPPDIHHRSLRRSVAKRWRYMLRFEGTSDSR